MPSHEAAWEEILQVMYTSLDQLNMGRRSLGNRLIILREKLDLLPLKDLHNDATYMQGKGTDIYFKMPPQ